MFLCNRVSIAWITCLFVYKKSPHSAKPFGSPFSWSFWLAAYIQTADRIKFARTISHWFIRTQFVFNLPLTLKLNSTHCKAGQRPEIDAQLCVHPSSHRHQPRVQACTTHRRLPLTLAVLQIAAYSSYLPDCCSLSLSCGSLFTLESCPADRTRTRCAPRRMLGRWVVFSWFRPALSFPRGHAICSFVKLSP